MSDDPHAVEEAYRARFRYLNERDPYPYQVRLMTQLISGRNVCLRAPTGSGKTKAVLTPFFASEIAWPARPARLIYALPLRSLVQQIYAEVCELAQKCQVPKSEVTIQTGEQPDDEFFAKGRVIVTTYDQVLSGLLGAPYGLSRRLSNINVAAMVGAIVVFDEFHLMELHRAFLTGAAGLRLFHKLTQSVWMTATATAAPIEALGKAIDSEPVTLDRDEVQALPTVAKTERELRFLAEPLTAEAVVKHADGRTIVIANTVERAQRLYEGLVDWADQRGIPIRLLHSRFFKPHRDGLVGELKTLFGPEAHGSAILIATQVVEAGVDISCDNLHTELCPMNALLQRAGRCARFPDQVGTVHVYELPDSERPWLPYGDLKGPDPALTATKRVLQGQSSWKMKPSLAEEWVQVVHGAADAEILERAGLQHRLAEVTAYLQKGLTSQSAGRVSDLIRESDDAQVRVIVASEASRPASPAEREALSVSRWAIQRLVRQAESPVGWYWDLSAEKPDWAELRTEDQAKGAYIICLRPAYAGYSSKIGLRLGASGDEESPPRVPPERPGHPGLRAESWAAHSRAVSRKIEERWEREGASGLAAAGLLARYGLAEDQVKQILRACGLLHDVGKLQQRWQDWAQAYQRDRDPDWTSREPLAHTDYDPSSRDDWDRSNRIQPKRGGHAVASAWYGQLLLARLLKETPNVSLRGAASACAVAVTAHHGGWIKSEGTDLDVDKLIRTWPDYARQVIGVPPDASALRALEACRDQRGQLAKLLEAATKPGNAEYLALVAYLSRALRLADQNATAEGGGE